MCPGHQEWAHLLGEHVASTRSARCQFLSPPLPCPCPPHHLTQGSLTESNSSKTRYHPQTKVSPPLGHGEFPSLGIDLHPTPRNSSFLSCPAPHTLSSPPGSSIRITPSLSLCLTHHILSPTFWGSPIPVEPHPLLGSHSETRQAPPPKLFLMRGKDILADNNDTR